MDIHAIINYMNKYRVKDVCFNKMEYLFIFESPHTTEINKKIPMSGDTGYTAAKYLGINEYSMGEFISKHEEFRIGIMNVSNVPMQKSEFELDECCWNAFKLIRSIHNYRQIGKHNDEHVNAIERIIIEDFRDRINNVITTNSELEIILCGNFSRSCFEYLINNCSIKHIGIVRNLRHPSRNGWKKLSVEDKSFLGNLLNYGVRYIRKEEMCEYQKEAIKLCKDNLKAQTDCWHKNSLAKVAACIYLREKNDYVLAQNVGISKVTGSLCAERAAIVSAIARYPDLKNEDIKDIFLVGSNEPLLPCGVCCEWLNKINPYMNIYTMVGKELLMINLKYYYGDESIIQRSILNKKCTNFEKRK